MGESEQGVTTQRVPVVLSPLSAITVLSSPAPTCFPTFTMYLTLFHGLLQPPSERYASPLPSFQVTHYD